MLPDYWMARPPLSLDASTDAAVDEFLSLAQPGGADVPIEADPILHARGAQIGSVVAKTPHRKCHGAMTATG